MIRASAELAGWHGWPGLSTCCKVRREAWGRRGPQSHECEDAYLISSLDLRRHTAAELLEFNRGHWRIENTLH